MQETQIDSSAEVEEDIVLELKGVSKHFGSVHAVEDATLQVKRGEVLTLLGPSGCGKTTTLRMVIGLERLTHGEITYSGRVVDSDASKSFVPPNKRNMGMVFQSYAIWPHMTVAENVAYPLKVRRVKGAEIRDRVSKVLEQVGLGGMEQRPATMLSGGQQQRVAVARSLVFEPDILLLDEPFSNLDAKLRDTMRTDLRILQQRLGITVLFVTHDQIEALSLSDRIVVMNQGNIEQVGTPMELYRNPKTAAVRDFLGRTVILEGTVEETSVAGSVGVRMHDSSGPMVYAQILHSEGMEIGTSCLLAVRPEGVDVEPLETVGDPDAPNTVRGVISTLLFIGDRFEARVELSWGDDIFLYLPPDDRWREGQPVAMRFAPHELHVWPASAKEVKVEADDEVPTLPEAPQVDATDDDQVSE
jgi:ABC-type Fe3+/spermidine/putrescine transport system ATPase subunit